MSQSKTDFITAIQEFDKPLWPFDISQRIREQFHWICLYRADPDLDPAVLRGYMVRPHSARAHSAADPAGLWCVISAQQSMGWQNLVWTKEMLQALDGEDALTSDPDKLSEVLEISAVHEPHLDNTPPHVIADKNGFTLALGCALPLTYRDALRTGIAATGKLDSLVRANLESYIPSEYVDHVLDQAFESKFKTSLREICSGCEPGRAAA